jgi:hypothetical protein
MPGSAVMEYRGCDVVLVSTKLEVVRSKVRAVWSWEHEYATVGSKGLKITPCTGPVCAEMSERGPFCGVDTDVEILRLLERRVLGRSAVGACSFGCQIERFYII